MTTIIIISPPPKDNLTVKDTPVKIMSDDVEINTEDLKKLVEVYLNTPPKK